MIKMQVLTLDDGPGEINFTTHWFQLQTMPPQDWNTIGIPHVLQKLLSIILFPITTCAQVSPQM